MKSGIFKFLHDGIITLEIICEGFNMKEIKMNLIKKETL